MRPLRTRQRVCARATGTFLLVVLAWIAGCDDEADSQQPARTEPEQSTDAPAEVAGFGDFAKILRLGTTESRIGLHGTARAVIGARSSELFTVPVQDLPAGELFMSATTIAAFKSKDADTVIDCGVRLQTDGRERELISGLRVPAGDRLRWRSFQATIPATSKGELRIRCEELADEVVPVGWAQPLLVPKQPAGSAPPLIVLMSLDTLRADYTAGFGGPSELTPQLERLGREGIRMLNATSDGTYTLSSHYGMLYSRLYGVLPQKKQRHVSLAQILADAGFLTIAVTGGGFMDPQFKMDLGFDIFTGHPPMGYGGRSDLALVDIVDTSLQHLRRFSDAPMFLFFHTYAVHTKPEEEREGWLVANTPDNVERAERYYRKLVRRTDHLLEPFFDRLRELSRVRPVLLIITSDHGEAFDEHDNFRHGYGDNATLHDEIIHVPFIVWGPGLVDPRAVRRPTMLVDLAPTILTSQQLDHPESMKGHDLWSLWSNAEGEVPSTTGSISLKPGYFSLRTPEHKLIQPVPADDAILFDLQQDPEERNNLAAAKPELVQQLQSQLRARLAELSVAMPDDGSWPEIRYGGWKKFNEFWEDAGGGRSDIDEPPDVSPELMERLKALGYH